jgi:hypothetical protein
MILQKSSKYGEVGAPQCAIHLEQKPSFFAWGTVDGEILISNTKNVDKILL